MAKKDYESMTEALIMPIIEANHFELVDVEGKRRFQLVFESLH